ncbi:YEATS domain-containing protein 4 [Histomonas meleagridis]|uniref:YEATS domain-containing protein 4 n=1 Tax=Histomonas meleagridis TaxID=135588 RepID=UPI00355A8F4F|nr:YEATS domain-containing protein 4 [Histomonas meleagridis]KAH0798703.1 YEATS domain-containing protein 4 [Histomonas meleagridis]
MIDDLVIEKKVVVGHNVRRLQRPTEYKTHHWEIFLYSPTGEDMTKWVEKVVFHLHESFKPPERICTSEPYKASEDGWGEFEATVEIFPKGAISFSLTHYITFPNQQSRKSGLTEKREEVVVFRNPPPILYEGLTAATFSWNRFKKMKQHQNVSDAETYDIPTNDYQLEQKWLNQITSVSQDIRTEIQAISEKSKIQLERINMLIENIQKYSPDVAELSSLFL